MKVVAESMNISRAFSPFRLEVGAPENKAQRAQKCCMVFNQLSTSNPNKVHCQNYLLMKLIN
jgi:hypothetical protein